MLANGMTRGEALDELILALAPDDTPPADENEKWRRFRALVNVRAPGPVSDCFLAVQDALLAAETAAKGVTDADTLPFLADGICLWRGDITALRADAIVNAANSGMTGCYCPNHACIDNVIHTYAGVQLRNECAALMRAQGAPEPTGGAKLTAAYNLPCRYVLHTVGPIVEGAPTARDRALLAGCYRACFALAEARHLRSIAYCCISTGVFHFPREEAAEIALAEIRACLAAAKSVRRVVCNVFTEDDLSIYLRLLTRPQA